MKANVGMLYVVAAEVATYTPYSGITYSAGFVVGEGREANITWENATGEFEGDDIILDNYEEIVGYNMALETAGLSSAVRSKMLGETKDSSDVYHVTGDAKPWLGTGFVRKMRDNTSGDPETVYEGVWYYHHRFSQPDEQTRTRNRTGIEWRVPVLNGRGTGVFLTANAETPEFEIHKDFETLAAAKAWLNTQAGITSSSGSST